MAVTSLSFNQIVSNFTAAVQATCGSLTNFAVGSVLLAIAQATGGLAMWLQALTLQAIGLSRAATSTGADLDSWMAQFAFTRIPGTISIGLETFGRNVTTLDVLVPVGAQVQTPGGGEVFTVYAVTTDPNWSGTLNGYVIPALTAAISVPIQSVTASAAANVASGAITQLVAPVPGVDYVTNALALAGGTDPESDAAFRLRFIAYLASLPRATEAALSYAISQAASPIFFSLTENVTRAGAVRPGYFFAVVNDGTAHPNPALLIAVYNLLFAEWRAFTIQYEIFDAAIVTANFSATLTTVAGFNHSNVTAAVAAALTAFINSLNLGQTCPYTRLIQICYDTVPGAVSNVSSPFLNGGYGDVTSTSQQAVRAGTIGIS